MASDDDVRPLPATLQPWRTCPVCGGGLEVIVGETGAQPNLQCAGECRRPWYANPKPTGNVLAVRADDGRLLLVRRAGDPFRGCWDVPGGFIEDGEEALDGAVRELREETGVEVRIEGFVGVFGDVYGGDRGDHTLNLFWRGVVEDPDAASASSDASELRWFARDELPYADELAFRCVPRAIEAWLREPR